MKGAILRYIAETYPDADVFTLGNGTYLSCDAEKNWPNFATIVRSDEFDGETAENGRGSREASRISRGRCVPNQHRRAQGDVRRGRRMTVVALLQICGSAQGS